MDNPESTEMDNAESTEMDNAETDTGLVLFREQLYGYLPQFRTGLCCLSFCAESLACILT